jgi:hypothetical protein
MNRLDGSFDDNTFRGVYISLIHKMIHNLPTQQKTVDDFFEKIETETSRREDTTIDEIYISASDLECGWETEDERLSDDNVYEIYTSRLYYADIDDYVYKIYISRKDVSVWVDTDIASERKRKINKICTQ